MAGPHNSFKVFERMLISNRFTIRAVLLLRNSRFVGPDKEY